jgi:small GTP-binding protein
MSTLQATFKIVFLGESGCGKTSIISRYIDKEFTGTLCPTVGCAGRTIDYQYRNHALTLLLWDTAGQELYRSLTPIYYRNSAAAIIVYDLSVRDTFEQIQGWIEELHSTVGDIVMVLCANKSDLEDARAVEELEGAALAHSVNAQFVETSAKTGRGLDLLFQTVVKEVMENKPELLQKRPPKPPQEKRKRKCC